MNPRLLKLYHRLPGSLRSAGATLQGYYLRTQRYGPETAEVVRQALDRDRWDAAQWDAWRDEQLRRLLHRAATQAPYYREYWAQRRRDGDDASWERLENWPILEKEPVRRNPLAFLAEDCSPQKMISVASSGTSGKPIRFYRSRSANRVWYGLSEARVRLWNGVSRDDRWANIGGQLVAPAGSRQPPFWVWNQGLRQLYLSSYHLAPDLMPHYLHALEAYRIAYLWGYSSSLYALARAILAARATFRMKTVIANAEPLYDYQREAIEAAFQCAARETYGSTELAVAASECHEGRLHLWPDAGVTELLEDGRPVGPGETGDVICTGLINTDMPLIRYRIGDRARRPGAGVVCACGRKLPMLAAVEGRCDDVLLTRDGRRIGRLDPVFKGDLPVVEAQIVQDSLDRITVRYVPAPGFTSRSADSIAERLRERVGSIEIVLQPVDEIHRGANGKFRAVISNLSPEEHQSIAVRG